MSCFCIGSATSAAVSEPQPKSCWDSKSLKVTLIVLGVLLIIAPTFANFSNELRYAIMGVGCTFILPVIVSCCRSVISESLKRREQKELAEAQAKKQKELVIENFINDLRGQTEALKLDIQEFEKIINAKDDPDRVKKTLSFWEEIKSKYPFQHSFRKPEELTNYEQGSNRALLRAQRLTISQLQAEVAELKTQLVTLRMTQAFSSVPEEVFLEEAKKYYLSIYPEGEEQLADITIDQLRDKIINRSGRQNESHWDNSEFSCFLYEIYERIKRNTAD